MASVNKPGQSIFRPDKVVIKGTLASSTYTHTCTRPSGDHFRRSSVFYQAGIMPPLYIPDRYSRTTWSNRESATEDPCANADRRREIYSQGIYIEGRSREPSSLAHPICPTTATTTTIRRPFEDPKGASGRHRIPGT